MNTVQQCADESAQSQQQIGGSQPFSVADGMFHVTSVNGQPVIVKPLGNGIAQIVGYIGKPSNVFTTGENNTEPQNQHESTASQITVCKH